MVLKDYLVFIGVSALLIFGVTDCTKNTISKIYADEVVEQIKRIECNDRQNQSKD